MNQNRRDFLKLSLAASATAAFAVKPASGQETGPASGHRDLLELRTYRLKPGADHALLDGYLEKALIPALNARGLDGVGVFTEPEAKDGPAVWVLIRYRSLEQILSVTAELNREAAVQSAGADYLSSPAATQPAFDRVDSCLLLAFPGQPKRAVPALARGNQPRIFELRTYESFSELKALKKIDMFDAGEIGVMQELGLAPVFYGQALVGRDLPHLTYMLCSPDRATHKKNWTAFTQHPTWLKLKADPQYADTVSKVTSRFLVPAVYSQI
jgi:NIPSNAP/TAT (twin-arginine translocation) pathway signal sequence